jgi:hypothetical protein
MDFSKTNTMVLISETDFEKAIYSAVEKALGNRKVAAKDQPRYVKGLKGIRELFGVSHATAQRYKDTILKDAVSQQGRVIIVDVEKALELFNENKQNREA